MNNVLKIILGLILIIYFFLYFLSTDLTQNESFSIQILLFNLLVLFVFYKRIEPIKNIKDQYIRIITIFILGYVIVFFQLHIDYVLGNFSEFNMRFWVNPKIVPKSLMISSIGFVSFLFGYITTVRNKNLRRNSNSYKFKTSIIGYTILSLLFLIVMLLTINPIYLFGGYGLVEMGSTARYSSILFELTYVSGIIQVLINNRELIGEKNSFYNFCRSIGLLHLGLFLLYAGIIFISGDRGPIIYLLVGIISAYVISTKQKVSKIKIFAMFFVGSILISSMVVVRNNQDDKTPVLTRLFNALISGEANAYSSLDESNSISKSTLELALSLRTLHNSVDAVPNRATYFYGQLQLLQIVTVLPFGQKLIKESFNIKDYELTSAKYVTNLIGGENGTEGTSCVADLYLDFGVFGVSFGLFFFGVFTRKIEEGVFKDNLPKLLILISYIVICQYAIYIPRSTIMFNFRNVIWILIIMKFIQSVSKKNK